MTALLPVLRRWHARLAPVVLAPLLLTVLSGMAYGLLRDWGGLSRDSVHLLMRLHEGEWLGPQGETVYVLLNGLGLLWMLVTGGLMLLQRWQIRRRGAGQPGGAEPKG
ncbi:MAG: peptidase [Synechococcus sp.]